MEDRYLFKAKRVDNGEWVQGALLDGESHCLIGEEIKFSPYIEHECKIVGYEVDRNTVCQCTGLKDKNGNLIWENDVMVAHLDDNYPEDETYIRVLWLGNGFCSKENGSIDITPFSKFDQEHFEVCGNIFDNKEFT